MFWYLTDWTATTYGDFLREQLFFQQLVEFFAVHQINHYPVDCWEHNLPHNLLGQWFIWWMVLLIQSSNSKYLRVWVNYCYHLTGEATWKSECLSCMPNWNKYKSMYRKIEIKINNNNNNSNDIDLQLATQLLVCNRVYQLITTTNWFELHYIVQVHV